MHELFEFRKKENRHIRLKMNGMLSFSSIVFVSILVFFTSFHDMANGAGGDCMNSGTIDCFECNSMEDKRCHDPFNYSIYKHEMPPTQPCEGCCVKMVQFIGTEHYQIKRTCTDNFEVNFFMVNHACMTEGHRHGHMCFCEEDECNAAMPMSKSIFSSNKLIPAQALGSFLNVLFGVNPLEIYQDHIVATFVSLSLLTFYQLVHSNLLSCSTSSSSSMMFLDRDSKNKSKLNHAGCILNNMMQKKPLPMKKSLSQFHHQPTSSSCSNDANSSVMDLNDKRLLQCS